MKSLLSLCLHVFPLIGLRYPTLRILTNTKDGRKQIFSGKFQKFLNSLLRKKKMDLLIPFLDQTESSSLMNANV